MCTCKVRLSVLFEDPFWIGLYERWADGRYAVCRIVFGAEPKDYDVYAFLLQNWTHLRFSPSIPAGTEIAEKRPSPKRVQCQIRKQLENAAPGTKAQQALSLQREQAKAQRTAASRERRQEEAVQQYAHRREKHREKHRGH